MAAFFSLDKIPDLEGEVWKDICGFSGKYKISNYGRVKSFKYYKAHILRTQLNNKGYERVSLSKAGRARYYLVHRLVAQHFVANDNPEEKNTVDHIDGNKENNTASNLRWLSLSDNIRCYWNYQNKLKEQAKEDETILHSL